ncbi:hypothetical protein ACLMJK_007761 [Lecanora helva]
MQRLRLRPFQTATTTVPSTTTPLTTTTKTSYVLVATTTRAAQKRDLKGRQAAASSSTLSTPSDLATFPGAVVTSACSLEATPVSVTSTSTVQQSTTVQSTVTATSTSTVVNTATTSATVTTVTVTSGITTAPTSTVAGATTTITSTTTITYASNAPSVSANYLNIDPDPNGNAAYALSDPATHMTDNFYYPNRREVFGLIPATNQFYSISNNSYYGIPSNPTAGSTYNHLYWNTNAAYGNRTFYGVDLNDGTGRTQVFLNNTNTGTPYNFCISTVTSDGNSGTGLHVNFYTTQFSGCAPTNLYLSPIANG